MQGTLTKELLIASIVEKLLSESHPDKFYQYPEQFTKQ